MDSAHGSPNIPKQDFGHLDGQVFEKGDHSPTLAKDDSGHLEKIENGSRGSSDKADRIDHADHADHVHRTQTMDTQGVYQGVSQECETMDFREYLTDNIDRSL